MLCDCTEKPSSQLISYTICGLFFSSSLAFLVSFFCILSSIESSSSESSLYETTLALVRRLLSQNSVVVSATVLVSAVSSKVFQL